MTKIKTHTNNKGELKRDDPLWLLNRKAPQNLRDTVDYDYINKLSPDEALWLKSFTDAHYTGARNELSKSWDKFEIKEASGRNNARRRDVCNMNVRLSEDRVDEVVTKQLSRKKQPKRNADV